MSRWNRCRNCPCHDADYVIEIIDCRCGCSCCTEPQPPLCDINRMLFDAAPAPRQVALTLQEVESDAESRDGASVPPPGFFIQEELEARGLSRRDLAYILGCSEQAVNMIVSGKRDISPEMAKALGDAFDVPAEFFANLQNAFAERDKKEI